jgi:type I restriction enzyme S subunit
MRNKTNLIPIKDIGSVVKRNIILSASEKYRTVGCKLYGLGVYERETKFGGEISASNMSLIKQNDFLINRIWAQKGSAGIVPSELDGSVVTNDFPVIELNLDLVFPKYIAYYVRCQRFWDNCRKYSHGTSGRERLSPKELGNIQIPLPSLEEQQQIVKNLEVFFNPVDEVNKIRKNSIKNPDLLMQLILNSVLLPSKHPNLKMQDVTILVKRKIEKISQPRISSLGVKWWGKGAYVAEEKNTSELRAERFVVKENDVIYNDMWARHGSVAIVPKQLDGYFASAHFPTWELDLKLVYPPFFSWCFRSPWFWQECEKNAQGSTGRNAITKSDFKELVMPVPSISEQRRIVAHLDRLQAKVDEVKRLLVETEREMEALVPAVLAKAFGGGM